MAGGVLLATALLPVVSAGSALASDDSAPSVTATATDTSYANQVAIGDAVKIGAPGTTSDDSGSESDAAGGGRVAPTHPAADSTEVATSVPDGTTATPSGAVVIETESHQPASESADPVDTSVAVLGTKTGATPDQLASTGPARVGNQVLLALALIGFGLLLVGGEKLWANAQRVAVRRH
jgi:hypothetical protein